MHRDNLSFLYYQLKNCIKNNFESTLESDTEYVSYEDKCFLQQKAIMDYVLSKFEKINKISNIHEEDLELKAENLYVPFGTHGYSSKVARN